MIAFTILGEPASKANSRELAVIGPKSNRRTILRKSDKALSYEDAALMQIPVPARQMLTGPVRVTLRIFYATERPDLDESIVLDVLQSKFVPVKDRSGKVVHRKLVRRGVYINDRQVREKHVFHGIDRTRPRAEIVVEALQAQQIELLAGDPARATT